MADVRNYTGVDATVFSSIKSEMQAHHIEVSSGDSGEINIRYPAIVTLQFTWDGAASLELTINSKPSFIPADKVWALTDGHVLAGGGSVA